MQAVASDAIIHALEAWGDLRDHSLERLFLMIYSNPMLQGLMGIRASDGPPRRRPGMERDRAAFIQRRVAEIRAGIAGGGLREAAIRGMMYIGLGGPGVDERAFNQLRQMRAQEGGLTLDEFKRVAREQFFALKLDPDGAVSAMATMVPVEDRPKVLGAIRAVTSAAGEAHGERARRLARLEGLLGHPAPPSTKKGAAA
jgi:hypothetical protein